MEPNVFGANFGTWLGRTHLIDFFPTYIYIYEHTYICIYIYVYMYQEGADDGVMFNLDMQKNGFEANGSTSRKLA